MDLIDDQGRVLGLVNVVDALAALLVLAVVIAGIALVDPFATPAETTTRYATVDLGAQPTYVAELIQAGDVMAPESTSNNVTVTDVFVSPAPGRNASVTLRVEIEGVLESPEQRTGQVLTYDDQPIRRGLDMTIATGDYTVTGTVTAVDEDTATLPTRTVPVTFQSTVDADAVSRIDAGDAVTVAGRDTATITDVVVGPGANRGQAHATVRAELHTLADPTDTFADGPVTVGRSITLTTDEYAIAGGIQAVNGDGITTTDTPVVIRSTVPTDVATVVDAGDEFRVDGTTVATIESVTAYPTGDPATERLLLALETTTVTDGDRQRFGTTLLTAGASVPFRTADYALTGSVVAVGTTDLPGEPATRTIEVKLSNVQPEFANNLQAGLSETVRGTEIATVTDVRTRPAVITLTSEGGDIFRREHPVNKDVTLTIRVRIRETPNGLTVHAQPLRLGQGVTFDFRTVTVQGTVVAIR